MLVSIELARSREARPIIVLGPLRITTPLGILAIMLIKDIMLPSSAPIGNICGALIGYACKKHTRWCSLVKIINEFPSLGGRGLLVWLAPPEKLLGWLEGRLPLRRLPFYVSMDRRSGRGSSLPTNRNLEM